jgi:phosphate transport system substrate-binding protein
MKRLSFQRNSVISCLIITFLLVAVNLFAEELRIGAGAAPTENILKPVKVSFEKATGISLGIIAYGPNNAFIDLEKGTIDAAAAGLSFDAWMALLKKEGIPVADPKAYQSVVIGKDKVIVLTHKSNPVKSLSKDQLKGIFTGKTTNWKDVGGDDAQIMIVWGKLIQGTNSMFVKNMLDGQDPIKDVLEVSTADEVKNTVESNPEAIGIGPQSLAGPTLNIPETPELARPITLLTKGTPKPAVQKLINFIATEGKKHSKE